MKIRVLLIEDEANHCQKYIDYNNGQDKIYILEIAHGCSDGLSLLERFQPDVVLLDLMLNESDGSGIEFLTKYKRLNLLECPQIIVITAVLSKQTHRKALELGADFIITKDKPDYSPKFVFDFIGNITSDSRNTKNRYSSEEKVMERKEHRKKAAHIEF